MDTDRRFAFAEMHADGCFLLPNAWDVGSARILELAGFAAIATTSAGVAFSLGLPDGGAVSREAMLGRVADIAAGVTVPVTADLENGYGDAPADVAATISGGVGAGAVGANIEDSTGDPARPLYDHGLAVERIQAAREAGGPGFVLNGRTDALLTGGTVTDALTRANAYLAAGADCAFVPGAADAETIGALVAGLDGPLNVVMGLTSSVLTFADLRDLGVRRVSVGGALTRALYTHLMAAARELADQGTFTFADNLVSYADFNTLFHP